jgi:hypothetical protein
MVRKKKTNKHKKKQQKTNRKVSKSMMGMKKALFCSESTGKQGF